MPSVGQASFRLSCTVAFSAAYPYFCFSCIPTNSVGRSSPFARLTDSCLLLVLVVLSGKGLGRQERFLCSRCLVVLAHK